MSEEVTFDEAQQALVNRLIGEARVKAREQAVKDQEAKTLKEKEEAERARLGKEQEYQTLSEQQAAKLLELEPLGEQVKAYQAVVEESLKDLLKELGDEAKKAVDGLPEGMDILAKFQWLSKNRGLFVKETTTGGTPSRKASKKPTEPTKQTRRKRF